MRIETSAGKVFPIQAICESLRDKNKILIEVEDSRRIDEVILDFKGLDFIKYFRTEKSVSYEMYEGFKKVVSITDNEDGTFRLTLEKAV